MPLKRPEPGAPWDKRVDAATLGDLLTRGPRPFDPARDVDFFDAVETYLRETLLSPAALSPYHYASAQHAVNEPETGWTLTSTPIGEDAVIPSAVPYTYTGESGVGYRFGAPSGGLPEAGAAHTLTVDLPAPVRVERVSMHFALAGQMVVLQTGTVGGSQGVGGRYDGKDTRYDVALIAPDGSVVAERLDVPVMSAGRIVSTRSQTFYLISGSYPSSEAFPGVAAVDLDVSRDLPAGRYGLRVTLRAPLPREKIQNSAQTLDLNAYPAARSSPQTTGPQSLLAVSSYPDGKQAAGAVVFDLRPTRPQQFDKAADRLTLAGPQLVRVGTPLGPSGTLGTRLVFEFEVADDETARVWGARFAVVASRLPDARLSDERDELAKLAQVNFPWSAAYMADWKEGTSALVLSHLPRRDSGEWNEGLHAGKRYRLEATHKTEDRTRNLGGGMSTTFRVSVLTYRLYDDTGVLVSSGDRARELIYAGGNEVESWRMALVLPPARSPLAGLTPALTVYRWQEWRE